MDPNADQPSASSYTPSTVYQWNSTGASNTIQRSGVGTYTVVFPGQTFVGGTAEVTAYGAGSGYCKVQNWYSDGVNQNVVVRCFSTSGASFLGSAPTLPLSSALSVIA